MANARYRLLIVDDEPSIREVVSDMLECMGYEIVTAEDGVEALHKLVETAPDVIISDLKMPRMSGFEFLAVVRQRFPHVPVIATSGDYAGWEVPSGVLADAFLPKGTYTLEQLS